LGSNRDARVRAAGREGCRCRPARGGFTLFEVVVALALVVVLGALGWVSLASLRETVSFEEGCAAMVEGVDAARVMASARGVPHEVRAVVHADRVEIQAAGLGSGPESGPESDRESDRELGRATSAAASARDDETPTRDDEAKARDGEVSARDGEAPGAAAADAERQWTTVARVRGRFAMDDATTGGGPDNGAERADGPDVRQGGGSAAERAAVGDAGVATITLGLALPDGSMIAAVPLRVRDGRARWTTIRVGTWTTRAEPEVVANSDATDDENAAAEANADGGDASRDGGAR
jgi:prepilin-type N-terminal cleavage/methylation domain-containing protein